MEKKSTLYAIAEALTEQISRREHPFDPVTLVFHNAVISQWFKAWYLKQKNGILMNVDFCTLSAFINRILNPSGEYHILTPGEYRPYLIKALTDTDCTNPALNFFKRDNGFDGIKLYDFSAVLADVLFHYEQDLETSWADLAPWQKELYDLANSYAEADGCYTPGRLFELRREALSPVPGDVYVADNSYISALYGKILSACGENIRIYSLDDPLAKDGIDIKVSAAPSILREVEWLHTEICQKLSEDRDTLVGDFVVYTPCITDYAGAIRRVFQKGAPGYPDIPFRIVGEHREKQDMEAALQLLYRIAYRGCVTRYDFSEFVKLPMVMFLNDLDSDDLSAFAEAIDGTNTHRSGDGHEDWDTFKKRLLTALLTDKQTSLSDGDCLPYEEIGLDARRINKMIDIADALCAWADLFSGALASEVFDKEKLESALQRLNGLFSRENKYGEEKNYLYTEVRREAEKAISVFDTLPALTFLLLLRDAPGRYSSAPADLFAGGVTFLNLDVDNIVPEKYVYVLGLSSKNFPRIEKKNEMDYSENHRYSQDLDEAALQNIQRGIKDLRFSYVNFDLQTHEAFYPSPLIPMPKTAEGKPDVTALPLDEQRSLDELFTHRALLNKGRISCLTTGATAPAHRDIPALGEDAVPVIPATQIKKYLQNTIVYKYSRIFGSSDEEDTAKEGEYEPMELKGLEKYNLVRGMILAGLEEQPQVALETLKLENALPLAGTDAGDNGFTYYEQTVAKPVIDILKNGYEKVEPFRLELQTTSGQARELEMNLSCYRLEEGSTLAYREPVELKTEDSPKDYLTPYICALADITRRQTDTEYTVKIKVKADVTAAEAGGESVATNTAEATQTPATAAASTEDGKSFSVTPETARKILNKIYGKMCDLSNIRYMDIELFSEIQKAIGNDPSDENKGKEKCPLSADGWEDTIKEHGSWKYFSDKKLLRPERDFGYGNLRDDDLWDAILDVYWDLCDCILIRY